MVVAEELGRMTPENRVALLTIMTTRHVRPYVKIKDLTTVFNRLVPQYRFNSDLCLQLDVAVRT